MLPDSQSSIQRTNNSSPCYLFLAACCVISLDNPKTKEKLRNPSHCIQLCPSNLKNKAHFPKVQLRDKHWINTDEENPDDWSDSRNPKLPYSRFYAHTVNALSSERRLARETSCCAVTRSAKTPEEPPVQVSAADSWGCPDIDLLVFFIRLLSSTYTMRCDWCALQHRRCAARATPTHARTGHNAWAHFRYCKCFVDYFQSEVQKPLRCRKRASNARSHRRSSRWVFIFKWHAHAWCVFHSSYIQINPAGLLD